MFYFLPLLHFASIFHFTTKQFLLIEQLNYFLYLGTKVPAEKFFFGGGAMDIQRPRNTNQ